VQYISLIVALSTEMSRKVRDFYSFKKIVPLLFVHNTLSGKPAFFLTISYRNPEYYSPHFDIKDEANTSPKFWYPPVRLTRRAVTQKTFT
jgi:hypothetical protein